MVIILPTVQGGPLSVMNAVIKPTYERWGTTVYVHIVGSGQKKHSKTVKKNWLYPSLSIFTIQYSYIM